MKLQRSKPSLSNVAACLRPCAQLAMLLANVRCADDLPTKPQSRMVWLQAYDRSLVRLRGNAAATNFALSDYRADLADYYKMQQVRQAHALL